MTTTALKVIALSSCKNNDKQNDDDGETFQESRAMRLLRIPVWDFWVLSNTLEYPIADRKGTRVEVFLFATYSLCVDSQCFASDRYGI